MKKFIIIILFLGFKILVYCQQVEPVINQYVQRFKQECIKRGFTPVNCKIKCIKFPNHYEDSVFRFDYFKPGKEWGGVVVENIKNGDIGIFLNPRLWYMSDTIGREMMIFHELFHAYFNLPHTDDEILMKAVTTDTECNYYKNHRIQILNDIFKLIKNRMK
jgi:hypothetical protein